MSAAGCSTLILMKQAKFTRKGGSIKEIETGELIRYKSKNAAKRASWKIQMDADKQLGQGTVRVLD